MQGVYQFITDECEKLELCLEQVPFDFVLECGGDISSRAKLIANLNIINKLNSKKYQKKN